MTVLNGALRHHCGWARACLKCQPWSVLAAVFAAIVLYWAFYMGLPLLSLGLIYLRGYRPEEMFTILDLAVPRASPLRLHPLLPASLLHVPHILHHTWKTRDLSAVPEGWRCCHASCLALHPNWTALFWTDEDARELIETSYPWFLPTYDAYLFPIQRVDAFRYFALYHYGGVYLDLDVGCRTPLGPLLAALPPGAALLPETWPLGVSNSVMMAPQRHPFFLHVMHALPKANRWYGSSYPTVLLSTGPTFVSVTLYYAGPWLSGQLLVLHPELFGRNAPHASNRSLFFHTTGSSWHGADAALVKRIVRWLDRLHLRTEGSLYAAMGIAGAATLWCRFLLVRH